MADIVRDTKIYQYKFHFWASGTYIIVGDITTHTHTHTHSIFMNTWFYTNTMDLLSFLAFLFASEIWHGCLCIRRGFSASCDSKNLKNSTVCECSKWRRTCLAKGQLFPVSNLPSFTAHAFVDDPKRQTPIAGWPSSFLPTTVSPAYLPSHPTSDPLSPEAVLGRICETARWSKMAVAKFIKGKLPSSCSFPCLILIHLPFLGIYLFHPSLSFTDTYLTYVTVGVRTMETASKKLSKPLRLGRMNHLSKGTKQKAVSQAPNPGLLTPPPPSLHWCQLSVSSASSPLPPSHPNIKT